MEFFGIDLTSKPRKKQPELKTFALDRTLAADASIETPGFGNFDGLSLYSYSGVSVPTQEIELIRHYRRLAQSSEIDEALQEIRNEVFVFDTPNRKAFDIEFYDEAELSDDIKESIAQEFDYLYNLVDFQNKGTHYFDDWYIDSKLIFHKIVDESKPQKGILKVNSLDPLKVRKIKVVPQPDRQGVFNVADIEEYYVYNKMVSASETEKVVQSSSNISGLKIKPESICYVHSGLYDRELGTYIGYLKKSISAFNNLKMIEDSMIIYRVVRAPQRRIFYVDVGNMQASKAEEYIKELQRKFKNRMVYDSRTGSLADRRNVMSMMEDFWMPRRSNGSTTEVQTLDGQQSQDILEEVEYFKQKLWRSLNVPISRFSENPNRLIFGRTSEIERDEYRFKKFIARIRENFLTFMEDLLKTQLILKKVIHPSEWHEVKNAIFWRYCEDNSYVEFKESELISNRINQLRDIESYVGTYFSKIWVLKNILRLNDFEIEQMKKEIESEPKPENDSGGGW